MLFLNGYRLVPESFPNGEVYFDRNYIKRCKNEPDQANCRVPNRLVFFYKGEESLWHLFLFLAGLSVEEPDFTIDILKIAYLPYSRMDRAESDKFFTLKIVANLINNLRIKEVIIVEPHSDICLALINNSKPLYVTPFIVELLSKTYKTHPAKDIRQSNTYLAETICDKKRDLIFFPDAGLKKDTHHFIQVTTKQLVSRPGIIKVR